MSALDRGRTRRCAPTDRKLFLLLCAQLGIIACVPKPELGNQIRAGIARHILTPLTDSHVHENQSSPATNPVPRTGRGGTGVGSPVSRRPGLPPVLSRGHGQSGLPDHVSPAQRPSGVCLRTGLFTLAGGGRRTPPHPHPHPQPGVPAAPEGFCRRGLLHLL